MVQSAQKSDINSGLIWFFGILIINISWLIFILVFYYNKSNEKGKIGATGERGFPGEIGGNGFVNIPCYSNNN